MPPYLRWQAMSGAEVPGGSCVKHGKEIRLSGDSYATLPTTFTVYRRFGFFQRGYRKQRGRAPIAPVGKPQLATPTSSGSAQVDGWILRSPGRRLKWRLFFGDDAGHTSDEVHVSRIGSFGVPAVQILGNGIDLNIVLTAAIDPYIEISLLTPWGEGDNDFHDYLGELAMDVRAEDEDPAEALAGLSEHFGASLAGEPPEGWELVVETTELNLDEGESAELGVRIYAPTPGEVAFAVQATAEIDGEQAMVASDPMVIQVSEDGSQQAKLLGSDDGSGDGSAEELPQQAEDLASVARELAAAEG